MEARWWSCVWALLCVTADVFGWEVFQEPLSITQVKVNSSAELVCSTSFPNPIGVSLLRGFHDTRVVMYLNIVNGEVTSHTTNAKFKGRIHVTRDERIKDRYGFRWQLSPLGVEDTNWYYCQWISYESAMDDIKIGTTIIVTETGPQEQCKNSMWKVTFVSMSMILFTVTFFFIIGTLIVRHKRVQKRYRIARAVELSRCCGAHHMCPEQRRQHTPYMVVSRNTLDIRRIF